MPINKNDKNPFKDSEGVYPIIIPITRLSPIKIIYTTIFGIFTVIETTSYKNY